MRKLSEYEGDEALDLLADIIVPATEIMADGEVVKAFKDKRKPRAEAVSIAIKKHKSALVEIMAALDGVPLDEYKVNVLSLPVKILQIMNDTDLIDFFSSAAPENVCDVSTSATVNTEANEK